MRVTWGSHEGHRNSRTIFYHCIVNISFWCRCVCRYNISIAVTCPPLVISKPHPLLCLKPHPHCVILQLNYSSSTDIVAKPHPLNHPQATLLIWLPSPTHCPTHSSAHLGVFCEEQTPAATQTERTRQRWIGRCVDDRHQRGSAQCREVSKGRTGEGGDQTVSVLSMSSWKVACVLYGEEGMGRRN